jgi:hypothetical protein
MTIMANGRKTGQPSRRQRFRAESRRAALWTALSVIALLGVGLAMYSVRKGFGILPWQRVPPYFSSVKQGRPLPKTLPPSGFIDPKVARGYEIARRIPEILVQQPSYCRLLRHHHSLLDCFSTYDAARCQVCLQEAYLTDRMTQMGKSPAEIRRSIIAGDWQKVGLE